MKIQRSRRLERQTRYCLQFLFIFIIPSHLYIISIEAMIDHHREGLVKLDNALQVERIRQERDMKDLITSKSPPSHPDLDLSSSSSSSSRQTSLPRPTFNPSSLRTPPKLDYDLTHSSSSSTPITTRPRSYSATPLSPVAISPSPYKPPKDADSPVVQLQRASVRKVYEFPINLE